jgi:hypothetical protein
MNKPWLQNVDPCQECNPDDFAIRAGLPEIDKPVFVKLEGDKTQTEYSARYRGSNLWTVAGQIVSTCSIAIWRLP